MQNIWNKIKGIFGPSVSSAPMSGIGGFTSPNYQSGSVGSGGTLSSGSGFATPTYNPQTLGASTTTAPSPFIGPIQPTNSLSDFISNSTKIVNGLNQNQGGSVPTSGPVNNGNNATNFQFQPGPSTLDLIRERLKAAQDQAGQAVQRATQNKNDTLGFITDQYGNLQSQAKQRLQSSLDTLGQEGTKLTDIYGRAAGDQRRRTANADLTNRNRARAMNRLDSSTYDNLQGQNTADLTRSLGVLDQEQANKQAALGTRTTDTTNYFNNLGQQLDTEQTHLKQQALSEYQQAVDQADALSKAGVMDFNQGLAQAQQQLQSRLDGIAQSASNLALSRQQAAAQIAAAGGNLNGFNALDANTMGTLGNNQGLESVLARYLPILGGQISGGQTFQGRGGTLDDLLRKNGLA